MKFSSVSSHKSFVETGRVWPVWVVFKLVSFHPLVNCFLDLLKCFKIWCLKELFELVDYLLKKF